MPNSRRIFFQPFPHQSRVGKVRIPTSPSASPSPSVSSSPSPSISASPSSSPSPSVSSSPSSSVSSSPSTSPSAGPNALTITQLTDHSVQLDWTKGSTSTHTYIVMKAGSAPTSSTDGYKVYNGTGESVVVNHLAIGTTYYFELWGNTPTYSLGTETSVTTPETPVNMTATEQYVFVALKNGGGVQVRRRDNPSTLLTTIQPTELSTNIVSSIHARGNYLMFTQGQYVYLYEFVSESDFTQLYKEDLGTTTARVSHIDAELEYMYTGLASGAMVYYDLATLTKRTFNFASDDLRKFDSLGNQMVAASNNNRAYSIDRTTRTTMSASVARSYTSNVEVVRVTDSQIFVGGDNTNVELLNGSSPYNLQQTLPDPTNDITGITIEDSLYHAVSSDDGKVYIYDVDDSYSLTSTITKTHGIEDCWMDNGDLYYDGGAELTADTKFYYRDYYTNSLSSTSLSGSQIMADI